jgi:hypothetical protein
MPRSQFQEEQAYDPDYAFQDELDTVSGTLNAKIDTTSGTLQYQHDQHVGDTSIHFPWQDVEDEVGTVSGTLQSQIDDKPDTFLELDDTPGAYSGYGNYLVSVKSTVDGLKFISQFDDSWTATVSGIIDAFYAEENTQSSSTSTGWVQKLRLVVTPRWSDYYLINFSANVSHEDTGVFMKARIQINDSDTYKESWLELYNFKYEDDAYQIWSGSFAYPMVSGTTYNVDLDYATGDSGKAMYIKETSLAAQRLLVQM